MKRVNVMLPDATMAILDRVAPKGKRSSFISEAVLNYVKTRGQQNLKERLKQGYLANAERDLDIARDWFPLEEEAWQKTLGPKKK
jgi:CopG family transcriptional regulator/antitoxin EndoAI